MNDNLFRKKSIDRINSPEAMKDYVQVASPSIWMMLIAIIILLLGGIIWSVLGRVETRVPVVVVIKDGEATCYFEESDNYVVTDDMNVEVNGTSYDITEVSHVPEVLDESNLFIATMLKKGEGILVIRANASVPLSDGIYRGSIVTEEIPPITFWTN